MHSELNVGHFIQPHIEAIVRGAERHGVKWNNSRIDKKTSAGKSYKTELTQRMKIS
jgi:hypothetical protein